MYVVELDEMVIQLGYKGLYALACDEDIRCLATPVRSFKLVEVYIEHGYTIILSYIRVSPQAARATIEDISEPSTSATKKNKSDKLLLLAGHDSSTLRILFVTLLHLVQPNVNQMIDDVIRHISFDDMELDGEAGFGDVAGRTIKLRNDILMFQQHQGESLSEVWTHFKDLLQKVPHHGIDLWLKVQIFYDRIDHTLKKTVDYTAGGRLRKMSAEKACTTIEELARYEDEGWNDPIVLEKEGLNYENLDLEQLLGIMECKVGTLMEEAITLMGRSESIFRISSDMMRQLPPKPSRQEAFEDLVMNFILDQEEKVKQLKEYMDVIGSDFMQLSSEVVGKLKEEIRMEENRTKKIKKIIRYNEEHIVEQVKVDEVIHSGGQELVEYGDGEEFVEHGSGQQVQYDVDRINSAYETQNYNESIEDACTDDDDGEDDDILVDEEKKIVEPDVDVHLFGISKDVPFHNIYVTNLVPEHVLEGEDVDVVNVECFDSNTG
ncbi:hypothetical protein Tco_0088253 [Tanacetum coccineum]